VSSPPWRRILSVRITFRSILQRAVRRIRVPCGASRLRRCLPCFLAWIAVALFSSCPALAQHPESLGAPQALIRGAREARLSEAPMWHRLLHYRKGLLGGFASDIDNPEFFLSPAGRHDPSAEIESTLAAFFSPPSNNPQTQHPQCRFPARYAWLKTQLDFSSVPSRPCERFELWRARLDVASVTLIFAAADLSNPASMYGHTFLRLNRKQHGAGEHLLDYTVNFTADTDVQNGLVFAYRGLTGGYQGRFSTLPYYIKVREYTNLQNRDLWEYDLMLNAEQIERLVRHLWEMGSASFDYYFLSENCAYQLLPLIEVVEPSIHLVEQFGPRVVPIDTVRVLLAQLRLHSAVRYRPSEWSRLSYKRARLAPDEAETARRLAEEMTQAVETELSAYPPTRQATILDTAYDYFQYLLRNTPERTEVTQDHEQRLLLRIRQVSPNPSLLHPDNPLPPPPISPDAGHGTGQIGIGFGHSTDTPFGELSIRPALHDLAAPDAGYLPNSHLAMFHLRLRYAPRVRKAFVEHLGLIEIVSLHPRDPWTTPRSWKMNLRIDPAKERGCARAWRCLYLGMNSGRGIAMEVRRQTGGGTGPFSRRGVGYLFAEVDIGVGEPFRRGYRFGGGATAGLLVDVTPSWHIHLTGGTLHYFAGDVHAIHSVAAEQVFSVRKDWELRLTLRRILSDREGLVMLNRYF